MSVLSTQRNPAAIRSQREVAELLGISKSRVMQIEQRALRKMLSALQRELQDDWNAYLDGMSVFSDR